MLMRNEFSYNTIIISITEHVFSMTLYRQYTTDKTEGHIWSWPLKKLFSISMPYRSIEAILSLLFCDLLLWLGVV